MKALSIQQPWAWLIVNGFKDVENRTWRPTNPGLRHRGQTLIHAGKQIDRWAFADVSLGIHPVTGEKLPFAIPLSFETGGIVGEAEIIDCVTDFDSDWFVGPYGFVLRNARHLPFVPCNGQLGFFVPSLSAVTLS